MHSMSCPADTPQQGLESGCRGFVQEFAPMTPVHGTVVVPVQPTPLIDRQRDTERICDLLLSRANTYELVGIVCLVETPPPRLLLCDKTLRLHLNEKADRGFLSFAFQSTPDT